MGGGEEHTSFSRDAFESWARGPHSSDVWGEGCCDVNWATSVVLDEYALEAWTPSPTMVADVDTRGDAS